MSNRILFVEDDPSVVSIVREAFEKAGYDLDIVGNGREGLAAALSNEYIALVLDVQLPEMSGIEICARVRVGRPLLPILMLTAQAELSDKVQGLESGADDYITKPFEPLELVARLASALRRALAAQNVANSRLEFGPLEIDISGRRVRLNNKIVAVTLKEFDLLVFLALRAGEVFSRRDLMEQIWGVTSPGFEPTVTVHLSRLRAKIEPDVTTPTFIETIHGAGYRFCAPDELTQ